ncbi:MAG: ubiquinol-cytochrome c reductase iron-sulfur subunit [Helicobacteraceae bacterium]|jgi:ubiquinol-cytochrome c reductase iron-sulfur subunit|nr:ubiquinol-cytochrome c reductase iron-sulfur subunit [Helicobacteraceae bacterium]
MEFNANRRGFIKGAGTALGVAAAAGAAAALYGMKRTWDPLPSAVTAGITEVNLDGMQPGEVRTVEFRRKPVFILKKTDAMTPNAKRDIMIGSDRYMIAVGICTHLGCIPQWYSAEAKFKCACHGGEFDASGANVFGPPPRALEIPPFKINGTMLTLGEESDEYKKLAKTA